MRGRAVILKTSTVITPFEDPASEAFFTHETLASVQKHVFGSCLKLEVVRVETPAEAIEATKSASGIVLLLLDRIYVSKKAAKDFIKAARNRPRPCALALSVNASVEYTLPMQDVARHGETIVHDLLLVDGAELLPAEEDPVAWMHKNRDAATAVEVPKREIVHEVQLPTIGEREKNLMRYPVTSTVVVSIEHWVHILWLNQIAFGIRWLELIYSRPLWAIWRALTAFSFNRHKLMARMVRKGRGTKIHPTAQISASILGKNVQVGANVTIRNSIVGDGAVIQDHSVLLNSVIGPRTLVTENTFLVSTVCYPDATLGNYKLQVSLIGRGAFINAWASFIDAKFVGSVKVPHNGGLASTERAFLGSVVGHRAKVAAKVLIQPGREIPNDTVIVMRPDEVVSDIPPDLPENTPLVRDRGTLVELGKESSHT